MSAFPRRRSTSLLFAATAIPALTLTGCTTTASSPDDQPTTANTFTAESAFGEVTLPTTPQAALGVYTTDIDVLITLGYPLANTQPIRSDLDGFPSYLSQEALEGVSTFGNYPEINFEAIAAAAPDFILNSLGEYEDLTEKLPDIAPTYSLNGFDGEDWRVHFKETATALNRIDKYEEWESTYEERLAEVKERIGDAADDIVVTIVYAEYGGPGIQTICAGQTLCSVYKDLGIDVLPLSEQDGGAILSPEEFDQLSDANLALTVRDYADMTELKSTETWKRLPFVQNDRILEYDIELSFGSPSSQLALLDQVEEDLVVLLGL